MTAPTGQRWNIAGIEILDHAPVEPPVSFVSQGAAVAGTTSITTAAYGTGWADGDLGVCVIASNHATVDSTEPTMPAGWNKIGTLVGGGGSQGAGTGNRRLTFFTRTLATGDDTTPTISLSTGDVMIAAITVLRKPTGNTWDAAVAAFGAETTAGTGWTQVMTTDPGFAAADMLIGACAVRDTSTSSAEGFSATGATFGTLSERIDSASETGNDLSLHVQTADVLTGPSSAAGTRTATHSTSETGVMGVLRVRSTASGGGTVTATASGTQAGTGTAAATVRHPATAVGTQAGAGAVVAKVRHPATATGTQAGTGAAAATVRHVVGATAAGTQAGTGAAAAKVKHPATAAGTQAGTGAATATRKTFATAAGTQAGTGTAAAGRKLYATAAGTQAGTGAAAATVRHVIPATAAGTQAGTGSAAATATPPPPGYVGATAAGTQAGTGTAVAVRTLRGVASTTAGAGTGAAAGLVKHPGTAYATGAGTGTAVALVTVYATATGTQAGTGSALQAGFVNTHGRVPVDPAEPRLTIDTAETRVPVDPAETRIPIP